MPKKEKIVLGRLEWIDFPQLSLEKLEAKIDTGAYSVALHSHEIRVEDKQLCFKLLDPSHPHYESRSFCIKDFKRKRVKSSNGEWEKRYMLKTPIVIGGIELEAEVTLTDRSNMKYPVLIGRKLLKRRFLVDVAKKYIHTKK